MYEVKNKLLVFLLVLVLVFSFLVFPIHQTSAIDKCPKISIAIEPKLELLGIICQLENDDYFACEILNTVIKRDAVIWFRPFKNRDAVKTYQILINQGYSDQLLRTFLLELGDLPELKIPETLSANYNNELFRNWRDQLVSFCRDSDFYTFWNKESEYYDQVIDQFVLENDVINDLNQEFLFFGIHDFTFHFVLSPLIQENQVLIPDQPAINQGILILGLSGIQNGRLLFGDKKTHSDLIQKDFLYLLVAMITKPFETEINRSQQLMEPIQKQMETIQIKTWQECFNRHLSLSIGILCFESKQSKKLEELNQKGFMYIQNMFDLLSQYSQHRDYFPSVTTFLPRIIEQFDSIARRG